MSQLDTNFEDIDADLDALLNQVGSSSSCKQVVPASTSAQHLLLFKL
jgi:hypothetical protein